MNILTRVQRPFLAATALVAALAASLVTGACSMTRGEPDPVWAESAIEVINREVLLNMTLIALQARQFPRGTDVDPNAMTVESGWKLQLAPFRGQGKRKKAVVQYERIEGDRWKVQVRVKVMSNMAVVNQLDASYAEWEWADDDEAEARVLLQYLRSSLAE
jgi:hypothetical protein